MTKPTPTSSIDELAALIAKQEMTKPVPTEEQREAARRFLGINYVDTDLAVPVFDDILARFLAEREAPLRERAEQAEAWVREAKAEAIPIADWFHRVSAVLQEHMDALAKKARYTAQASTSTVTRAEALEMSRLAVDEALEAVRAIPGWTGEEHTEPSHYVLRDVAERERDHARANLATLQREHVEQRCATEAARIAIAQALGLTEWRALADLAADVTDLGDALTSARAEVARLTGERDEAVARAKTAERRNREGISVYDDVDAAGWVERVSHALGRFYDYDGPFVAAESDTVVALIQETARRHVAAEQAVAASRAEVEALRAALDDVHTIAVNAGFEEGSRLMSILSVALSSTPAPASAEVQTHDDEHKFDRVAGVCLDCDYTEPPASAEPSARPTRPPGLPPTETVFGVLMAQSQQIKAGADASAEPAPFNVDAADEAVVDALVRERAPRSTESRPLASAEPATPFTDEGSNGFVERAGKGSTKPATPTASLKKGDRVVWSETGEPGVVVEVQPGESPTVVVDFGPGWFSRRISVDMLSLATPTTEGGAK